MGGDEMMGQRIDSAISVFISFVVVGELYFGARNSDQMAANIARVDRIVALHGVLYPTIATTREYGVVRVALKSAGRPIPDADVWIAALAIESGFTLVTRDRHFQGIDRLNVENW